MLSRVATLTTAVAIVALLPGQQPRPRQLPQAPPTEFLPSNQPLDYLVSRLPESEATPVTSVAGVSWMMLAFDATGSTLRMGQYRQPLRVATRWLRKQQDDAGLFLATGKPCSRFDQLIATYAFAQVAVTSNYKLLHPTVRKGTAAVVAAFEAADSAPATAEEVALLLLLAERAKLVQPHDPNPGRCRIFALAARRNLEVGRSRRSDAALHLASELLGESSPAALTVARAWPTNPGADPLHTWLGLQALTATDRETWRRETQILSRLAATRRTTGDSSGSWPGTADLEEAVVTGILATVTHSTIRDPFEK